MKEEMPHKKPKWRQLPEIFRNNWFQEDCPQARWAKVHKTMLRHLTTEKGTKMVPDKH